MGTVLFATGKGWRGASAITRPACGAAAARDTATGAGEGNESNQAPPARTASAITRYSGDPRHDRFWVTGPARGGPEGRGPVTTLLARRAQGADGLVVESAQ